MKGDWHPESRLRVGVINIQTRAPGELHHVGVGYELVSPNGAVLASKGFTWDVPVQYVKALEEILAELVAAAVEHEGVAGADHFKRPVD